MKRIIALILPVIFTGNFLLAQQPGDVQSASSLTGEQIKEYKNWMRMKDDWANLARYHDANEELGPPAKASERVVFMGNSITDAWIKVSPGFFEGKDYIDRGISGQTTPQMLIRFRPDVIDLDPGIVLILAGTNDIAGNTGPSTLEMIEGNIASMAQLASANGIKVILCSVLPAFDYPWKPGLEPAQKIVILNEWIRKYARKNKFDYLDYYSSLADEKGGMKDGYSFDGVHPNEAGYRVMEDLAEKAIGQARDKKGRKRR